MILNVQVVMALKRALKKKNEKKKDHRDFIMKIHRCKRCNYLYIDEEQKIPFEKISDEWRCPKCRSSKKIFVEKEIPEKN